jgi:hypothetical protein
MGLGAIFAGWRRGRVRCWGSSIGCWSRSASRTIA